MKDNNLKKVFVKFATAIVLVALIGIIAVLSVGCEQSYIQKPDGTRISFGSTTESQRYLEHEEKMKELEVKEKEIEEKYKYKAASSSAISQTDTRLTDNQYNIKLDETHILVQTNDGSYVLYETDESYNKIIDSKDISDYLVSNFMKGELSAEDLIDA